MQMIDLLKLLIAASLALALQTGCVPQPGATYPQGGQGNLTMEARLQDDLSDQKRSIQELSRSMAELEARVAFQQKELEGLRQQMSLANTVQPAVQSTVSSPGMVPAPTAAYNSAADLAGTPTEIYLRSFGDYANGRYDAAILGFDAFLRNFPNNSYASNAQFWLADSYLKQQQLPRAIEEFNKLLQFYPNADKAPEALLKIATAQLQLDKPGQARETLETLRRRHPDSAAAQKAEKLVLP